MVLGVISFFHAKTSFIMLTSEQQIFEQIKKAKSILITFSKTWNGDSVASGLAMYLFLKKIGKDVEIVAENNNDADAILQTPSRVFSFLPDFGKIKNAIENLRKFIISLDISNAKVSQIKYRVENENTLNFIISPKEGFFTEDDISSSSSGFKYDLIITLDTPDLESLGRIYDNDTEFFYKTTIINIDHHSDNEEYGQINKIELNSVATSEILFNLLTNYSRDIIDENIATCLLTGIITKTKSFKTQNITPNTLLITSQLISMGARREEIVNKLYRSRALNVLKLWGKVLACLQGELDDKLIYSTITQEDFTQTGSNENDINDVIEELIVNIPQAKIITIIYEKEIEKNNQTIKQAYAIVYSVKNINSMDLIREYKPEGTKRIAHARINKPIEVVQKELIDNIKSKLEKLPI